MDTKVKTVNTKLVFEDEDLSNSQRGRKFFHGYYYQILVTMLCIIRAHKRFYDYKIIIEAKDSGDFDDIVILYKGHEGDVWHKICIQTKHVQETKLKISGDDLLGVYKTKPRFKISIKDYLPSFLEIRNSDDDKELENLTISTNIEFNFINTRRRIGPNIFKIETKKFGMLYLQKIQNGLLSIGGGDTYRFLSRTDKNRCDLYQVTKTTIENFFDSFSDYDKLAIQIVKLIYKRRYPRPARLLSFNEDSKLKPFQEFLLKHVICKKKGAENNERFFCKKFHESSDENVVKFRCSLEKKIRERYELDFVNFDKFRFYVDDDFEANALSASAPFKFEDNHFEYDDIEDFIEKFQFTVGHPSLNTFMDELKREMKTVSRNFEYCDTTLIVKSLVSDIVNQLSEKSSNPYTKNDFENFLESKIRAICDLEHYNFMRNNIEEKINNFMDSDEKILNLIAHDLLKGSYFIMKSIEERYKQSYFFLKSSSIKFLKSDIVELQKENLNVLILEYDSTCNVDLPVLKESAKKIIIVSKEVFSEDFEEIIIRDCIFLNNESS